MHHIIIGCGAAGRAALHQIRKYEPTAEITVVSAELDPFYLRPYLSYFLIDEDSPDMRYFQDETLRDESGVNYKLGVKAIRLLARENAVELSDGDRLTYNFLLIAAGTRFKPEEIAPEGVQYFTLKSKSDAMRLRREAEGAESILIYGGGYQALELTRIFHVQNRKVRWIAPPGFFWPRTLPGVTASQVHDKLTDLGLDVVLNHRIVHAVDMDGRRYRITDDAGETFDCDLFVLAPAETPNVDFLRPSAVHCDIGVIVNEELRTNIPNVFAAGDCAQIYDINSGHSVINFGWKSAAKQGIIAGENMAGSNQIIIPTRDEFVLDLMGKKLLERW